MFDGIILVFDFGEKCIGVVIGEILLWLVYFLMVIYVELNDDCFVVIGKLVVEW